MFMSPPCRHGSANVVCDILPQRFRAGSRMHIDKNELLAGIPAKRLRDTLRKMDNAEWSPDKLTRELGVGQNDAVSVLAALVAEGYIEAAKRPKGWLRAGQ